MINLKLENDYNVCSGNKFYLKEIINNLNKKLLMKTLIFKGIKSKSLIGSNLKLKNTGWNCKRKFDYIKILNSYS